MLLVHLVKNHPLPDVNRRCGYLACREFVAPNGYSWTSDSVEGTDRFVRAIASDEVTLDEVAARVARRTG